MSSISADWPSQKRWLFVAVTICLAAALTACSAEPVKQALERDPRSYGSIVVRLRLTEAGEVVVVSERPPARARWTR